MQAVWLERDEAHVHAVKGEPGQQVQVDQDKETQHTSKDEQCCLDCSLGTGVLLSWGPWVLQPSCQIGCRGSLHSQY
jgi:hypothetical protein